MCKNVRTDLTNTILKRKNNKNYFQDFFVYNFVLTKIYILMQDYREISFSTMSKYIYSFIQNYFDISKNVQKFPTFQMQR